MLVTASWGLTAGEEQLEGHGGRPVQGHQGDQGVDLRVDEPHGLAGAAGALPAGRAGALLDRLRLLALAPDHRQGFRELLLGVLLERAAGARWGLRELPPLERLRDLRDRVVAPSALAGLEGLAHALGEVCSVAAIVCSEGRLESSRDGAELNGDGVENVLVGGVLQEDLKQEGLNIHVGGQTAHSQKTVHQQIHLQLLAILRQLQHVEKRLRVLDVDAPQL
mmetsp:Transcript_60292/g.176227  ORF Transcript_60292/g.176227 Transcript_60292/m.176227 type:complete len:222 (+) Transcript_60292:154-819(+)